MHLATSRSDLLNRVRQRKRGFLQRFDTRGFAPRKGWRYRARLLLEQLEVRNLLSAYQYLVGPAVNISRSPYNPEFGSIVVDRTNADRLFATALGTPSRRYSVDGGQTWQTSDVANIPRVSDTTKVATDPFGNLFMTYFSLDASSGQGTVLAWSTDFGRTFAAFTTVIPSATTTPYRPSLGVGGSTTPGEYTIWVSAAVIEPGRGILATGARITGLGRIGPFSPPQPVPGSIIGSQFGGAGDTKVGPNGEVIVSYQFPLGGTGPSAIFVNVDPDGLSGAFGPAQRVTSTNVGSRTQIPPQLQGIDAEANLAWDFAKGRVYLAYTDRPDLQSADTDIYLRYSDDEGSTWSKRLRVNDDTTTNSQFNPAIALDPITGYIAVSWYDARNVPTNDAAEVWAAASVDGGASFLPNVKLSPGISDGNAADSFGNYDTMDFYDRAFYRIWADNSPELPDNPNRPHKNMATARVQVGTPAGPYVIAHTPVQLADPAVSSVRVTFNEPIDVKSFSLKSVASFTGPDGDIPVDAVTVVPDTNDTQFDVTFAPQDQTGRYALVLGPDIRSRKGIPMDQDFDGAPGEKTDTYTARFAISSFKVTGHTPNDYRFGPVNSVRVTFNRPVNAATFTPDQIVSFSGPNGAIPVQHISAVPGTGNLVFAVALAPQTAGGTYTLVIGPQIRDMFGNPMDQNEDLVSGEEPGDRYTATFRLADPCLGPDGGGYTACAGAFEDYSIFGQPGTFTIIQGPVDQEADPVDLGPNTFTFYGHSYTGNFQLFVSSEGLITFGAGNPDYRNSDLTTSPPQPAIAVLWDYWEKRIDEPMVVGRFEDLDGDGVAHRLVIEWYQVRHSPTGSPRAVTFQAILYLNTGPATHFTLNYFDLDTGDFGRLGATETVGIKAAGNQGPDRILVSRGQSPYVGTDQALFFSADGEADRLASSVSTVSAVVAVQARVARSVDPLAAKVDMPSLGSGAAAREGVPPSTDLAAIDRLFASLRLHSPVAPVSPRAPAHPLSDLLAADPWLA